jgi:putative ABC transport system permease protein
MNRTTLLRRGLSFYRRTHLGVVAGCAVSAAVLVGALFVGDSVKGSLERIALSRLGRIQVALDTSTRYVRDDLARRMGDGLKTEVAAALHVQAMGLREDGKKQINRVEVVGVDPRFLAMAPSPAAVKLGPGQAAINRKLAAALGAKEKDEIALRLFKPGLLSKEAPLSSAGEKDTQRTLVTVVAVLSDDQLGRFSLKSDQAGPHTAFVDLAWLQEQLEMPHKANLIVAGESRVDAQEWLKSAWTFEDLGLLLRSPEGRGAVQLQSERIYLDPAVSVPARGLRPDTAGVLYYLIDALTSEKGKSTPYSFVTAVSPSADPKLGPVPIGMKDDEILINRWVADQLGVKEGDPLELAYSELTAASTYVPKRSGCSASAACSRWPRWRVKRIWCPSSRA